jgi:glutamate---cysteine ligase / carboxylate-amine ligase
LKTEFTVGAEEEYQLVDAETGALRSRAPDVLSHDWSAEIHPELHETTLEIGTRVCSSAAELEAELGRLRFHVSTTAAAEGMRVVAAGGHPFTRWEAHEATEGERYERMLEQYGRVAWDETSFGMHIHVGVPDSVDRVQLLDRVRVYVPHLLALSCSSPFFEGADTGYASYRSILWRRWPYSGVPPRFGSMEEYCRLVDRLIAASAIDDERSLYWSIRPHSSYPTLEFRVPDVCPRMDDAVAVASLARALVVAAHDGRIEPDPRSPIGPGVADAILSGNEWRAARYGLDATLVEPAANSGKLPLRSAVRQLLEVLAPVADALGDTAALAHLETILEHGNGSDRMRRVYRDAGAFPALMQWLADETLVGTGPDRRSAQREG